MKNKFYLIICLLLLTYGCVMAQSVEINPASSSSAIISSTSTNKGLLVPRMTDTQRAAIASPATGLMVYQTNGTTGFYFWNGTTWVNLGGSGGTASELQKITEGSNTGWRILGRDAANYGDIGVNALDLSASTAASTTKGATGTNALATGTNTTASGFSAIATGLNTNAAEYASTAMGAGSKATGFVSIAAGNEVLAKSFGELAIGSYNDTLTTVNSTGFAGDNNRIFTVGTGTAFARRTSFVVQQNGNVGIGASSPNAQLQLGNTLTNRKLVLFEFANNDHQYYGIGINNQVLRYQVDANVSSHAFFAGSSASTSNELMRITGTGNVGIGTTAPNAPLQFANTAANRKIVLFDGINNDHQYFGFGINTSMLRYQVDGTASVHAFFAGASATTSNELMRITGTGNVGIGSTTPNAQLQLGNTIANRKVILFEVANNDHQYYGLGVNNQIFRYQVDNTISSHAFYAATSTTASTELMRITGTGNVGIGTTAPTEKLHVVGSVRIVDGTEGAGKVLTSDANGRGTWSTPALSSPSELQKITEGSNTGWRILGRNAANYGDIGSNAIDLSNSTGASTINGATGVDAFATGTFTIASGQNSTATGFATTALNYASNASGFITVASGISSSAMGYQVKAKSFSELAIGYWNDTLTTVNAFTYAGDNNRVFTVGVGTPTTRATAFVVQQNSNVGIGTGAPTQRLHVVGNIVYTGSNTAISDLRYKKNFSKIENPLKKVLSLNGLHYDWRIEEFKENNFTKDRQIGFIAQEIEEIFPEMVLTDAKGYKSVDYARLTPVLVEAIKELKTLNDELKGKNEKLEENSQKIEARLSKIEALLYK
jgi:hypothetical protein